MVDWLLEAEGVGTVDGGAYGLSPYFRVSIAASDAVLADAAQRIARAVAALLPVAASRGESAPLLAEPA